MDTNRRTLLVALAIAASCLAYLGTFTGYGINLEDEGTVLSQMARFASGQDLYTDFHIGYTPGVYWVHGLLLRAFDGNLIPGRLALALATSTAAVLLFLLAWKLSGRLWLSALAPLLYIAIIPVHPGAFASFNIPYPVWYAVPLSVAGMLALLRFGQSGAYRWLAVAGLIAGVTFSFKPNTGLFQLAVTSMVTLAVIPLQHQGDRKWTARGKSLLWWSWWLSVLGGVALVFSGATSLREPYMLVTPFAVGALLVAWRSAVVPPGDTPPSTAKSATVLGLSFLLPTAPWLLYYHHRLGTQHFLERALYFRAELETFYYYPIPPLLVASVTGLAALLLLTLLPKRLGTSRIRPGHLLIGFAMVVIAGLIVATQIRPMPEGFYKAVMSQFEFRIFAASAVVHWIALWVLARSIGTTAASRAFSLKMTVMALAAIGLYLPVYPRSDYMHWVTAGPLTIVAAAVLLSFLADRWSEASSPALRRAVAVALATPLLVLAGMRLGHHLSAVITLDSGLPNHAESYKLDNRRAPIWINLGRGGEYRDLADVSRFIEENTNPDEGVFTFPSLDVVSFMSGRHNPTRHGYFYPGWPGRAVEAEVISDLIKTNPRFVVVFHGHPMFFMRAAAYFYQLDRFIEQRYRPYARFGRYVVLANKDQIPSGRGPWREKSSLLDTVDSEWLVGVGEALRSNDPADRLRQARALGHIYVRSELPVLTAALEDPDQGVRNAAAHAYSSVKDAGVTSTLLAGVTRGIFSPDNTMGIMRAAHAAIDTSAAPSVIGLMNSHDLFVALTANDLLYTLSNRDFYASHWFGKENDTIPSVELDEVTRLHVEHWLTDVFASTGRRYFSVLHAKGESPNDCPAGLEKLVVGEKDMQIRILAMWEATRRDCGYDDLVLKQAINFMMYDDTLSPRIALKVLERHHNPDLRLASAIRNATDQKKMNLLWLAAQIGGKETARETVQTLADPDPAVRVASAWALGNRGSLMEEAYLTLALGDDDANVAEMAERALVVMRARHGS